MGQFNFNVEIRNVFQREICFSLISKGLKLLQYFYDMTKYATTLQ